VALNGRIEANHQAGVRGINDFAQTTDKPQHKVEESPNYQLTLDGSKTLYALVRRENTIRQMLAKLPEPITAAVNQLFRPVTTTALSGGMDSMVTALFQTVSNLQGLVVELEQARALTVQQAAATEATAKKSTDPAAEESKGGEPASEESPQPQNRSKQTEPAANAARQEALLKWQALGPTELRRSKLAIERYTDFLRQNAQAEINPDQGTTTLSMVLPYLTVAQEMRAVYLHIYHEQADDKSKHGKERQTWLRVLMETDNLGVVEACFHYWPPEQVDVRLIFGGSICSAEAESVSARVQEIFARIPELKLVKLDIVTPGRQRSESR